MKKKLFPTILALVCAICCIFSLVACDNGDDPQEVAVTGVTLNKTEIMLEIGGEETLTATVTPDNATNKTVTWTADKPEIADVDDNGKVTAKTAGTAVITAKSGDKSATCTVTVTAPVKMTKEQWDAAIDATITAKNFTMTIKDYETQEVKVQIQFDDVSGIIYRFGSYYIAENDGVYCYYYDDEAGVWYKSKKTEYLNATDLFNQFSDQLFGSENDNWLFFKDLYDICEYNGVADTYTVDTHDDNSGDWEITFKNGKVYKYEHIECEELADWIMIHDYGTTTVTLPEEARNAVLAED